MNNCEEVKNMGAKFKALEGELEAVKKERDICRQINLEMLSVCMNAINADEFEKAKMIIKNGIHEIVINRKGRI